MSYSTAKRSANLGGWYALFALLVAYTLSFLDRSLLSLLIAPVKHDLGLSDTGISLLLGFAFALLYTLMGLPLGWLADHRDRTRLVATGITLWSAMTAMCGLAPTFAWLFVARIGVGVGEATLSPAAYSMLSDYFPKNRLGRVMAIYSIGLPLGSGIALGVGGAIVATAEKLTSFDLPYVGFLASWRWSFVLVGCSGLVITLLMLTVREPSRSIRQEQTRVAENTLELLSFLLKNWQALGAHFVGIGLFVLTVYGNLAWTPTFLSRTYHLPIAEIGTTLGVITAAGGAFGLLTGGGLADFFFARGRANAHLLVVFFSVLVSWPLFVLVPLMPSAGWAFVALIPATIASTIHGGIAGAALQLMTPNHLRAQVIALYFFVANLVGLGLGPTVVATVTDFVFRDENALRYALVIVSGTIPPVSALIILFGLSSFRRAVLAMK